MGPTAPWSPRTPLRSLLPRLLTQLLEALFTPSTPSAMLLATLTSEAWLDTPTLPPAVPSTMPSVPTPTLLDTTATPLATLTPTTTASSPCTLASLDSSPTPTVPSSQSSPLMLSPPGRHTLPHTPREPSSLLETIY